jgi:HPt (histidine-containing phosphotransfer) domain-containing protein
VQSLDNYTAPISPKEQLNIAKQYSDKDWFVQDTASILLDDIGISAFVQISNLFLAEIDEGVQQICSAYQHGDIELLADHAHTIRSSASSIGCQALGQHLAFIESAAQSNTTLALDPLISMLPVIVKKSSDPLIIYLKAIVK